MGSNNNQRRIKPSASGFFAVAMEGEKIRAMVVSVTVAVVVFFCVADGCAVNAVVSNAN